MSRIIPYMAETDSQPRKRRALFGIGKDYAEALEARLAQAEAQNAELAGSLRSARLALDETAGWSERLPDALRELASLAAGEVADGNVEQTLADALLRLAGEHLLSSVTIARGEPAGELESETRQNENGRPIRTTVRLGGIAVDATWQPGIEAGADTTGVIERLCAAVVCSLAGVQGAPTDRDMVTQLADARALARHLALRQRLGEPAALVRVTVDGRSVIAYRELYGRLAWSASLAQAAIVLERIARAHGGQAYQTGERELRLLVDLDQGEQACGLAEDALAEGEGEDGGLVFRVELAQR
jgi:hypothetical protein